MTPIGCRPENSQHAIQVSESGMRPPTKEPAAVALGRLTRGIPKRLTPEERERRRLALAAARSKRWPQKAQAN